LLPIKASFISVKNLVAASLLALAASPVNLTLCIPVQALNFSNHHLLAENIVVSSPLNLFSQSDENRLSAFTIMLLLPVGIHFLLQSSSQVINLLSTDLNTLL
jgi:hypothetical protein